MSTISSAPAPQGLPGQSLLVGALAALKRWWMAYLIWRMEQAAIAHLWSLSDRTLKDMGLTRSEFHASSGASSLSKPAAAGTEQFGQGAPSMNVEMKHPARPPRRGRVIALHCSGAGAGEWRALAEALACRHDVEAPEHYGCESTGMWSGEHAFTLADEASRAIALIDASAGQVHLVGHSYGGAVALHAALDRPDRIASIALYEPSVFHLLGQMGAMSALALAQIARVAERVYRGVLSGDYRGAVAGFVDYWNGPGAWDAMRPAAQKALIRWAPKGPLEFRAVLENATPASAYRALNAPVLILRGEHALLPSRLIAESLSQLLPAARLTVVAGAAHMGPLTHAGEVCALISRHIAAAEESRAAVIPAAARFLPQPAQIRVYP